MNRTARLLLPLAWAACGCNWVSLAQHSITYRTTQRGEAANLWASGPIVYATLADAGLAVLDAATGRALTTIAPPDGQSIDDVALADGLLFALDARPPGHLSVYSLSDPAAPRTVGRTLGVPVGPFSGISAADGLVVVSGGTSQLTIWRYGADGSLSGPLATADLGRGQPDVLLTAGGWLYVSTHYWGPYFGLDVAHFDASAGRIDGVAKVPLDGAGFTTGGAKPANFPIEAAILGTDTLLVASARGVDVLGVGTPAQPQRLTTIDVGGPAVNVDVAGRLAAVTIGGASPALVYLEFTTAPLRQRRVPLPAGTFPGGVALGGPRAVVAAGPAGVLFITK